MSDKRERSRQQWEQESQARQQNVTPADYPEGLHYVRADGLPKIISQVRFWAGIVLVVVGASALRSEVSLGFAVVGIAIGLCLTITSIRLNKR